MCEFHLNFPVRILPVGMEMKFARRIGCAHPLAGRMVSETMRCFPTVCLFNAFWAEIAIVKSINCFTAPRLYAACTGIANSALCPHSVCRGFLLFFE